MTLTEFKAWFEGFSENITGEPNKAQWRRIQARVGDIDGDPVTPLVIREYVDRYKVPYYPSYYGPTWVSNSNNVAAIPYVTSSTDTVMLGDLGRNESMSLTN